MLERDTNHKRPDAEGHPGFQVTDEDHAEILGAPVGCDKLLDDAIEG